MKQYTSSIPEWLNRIFNTKAGDMGSSEINDTISPVIIVAPRIDILGANSRITTGTTTIFTATKRTYITGIQFDLQKDATCDQATGAMALLATIDGASRTIMQISTITLTAQSKTITMDFSTPLLLEPGATITSAATYTVGVMCRAGTVFGYEVY